MVQELYDAFYGMREFIIRDCNGFWITFGQAIQAQLPPQEGAAMLRPLYLREGSRRRVTLAERPCAPTRR